MTSIVHSCRPGEVTSVSEPSKLQYRSYLACVVCVCNHCSPRSTGCLLQLLQCSKLLADTSVIQFYPSKFVLITDILDNFGTLAILSLLQPLTPLTPHSPTLSLLHPPPHSLTPSLPHPLTPSLPTSPLGHLVFDRIFRKSTIPPPGTTNPVILPGTLFKF